MNTPSKRQEQFKDIQAMHEYMQKLQPGIFSTEDPSRRSMAVWGADSMKIIMLTAIIAPNILLEKENLHIDESGPPPRLPLQEITEFLKKTTLLLEEQAESATFIEKEIVVLYILTQLAARCFIAFDDREMKLICQMEEQSDEYFQHIKQFYLKSADETLEYISNKYRGDADMVKALQEISQGRISFKQEPPGKKTSKVQ
ncbi:MAG: hypothetical protein ABR936_15955 [Bacteroidota bacterium]|jgi:hypothetical protein